MATEVRMPSSLTRLPALGLLVDQAFLGSDLVGKDAWRAAAEAGASWISITEEALGIGKERLAQLCDNAVAAGIDIAVANCHAFSLSDPRDAVREFNLERVKRHVELVPEFGARQLKLLLGEWVWRGMWPDELQWSTLVDSVRAICAHAYRHSVELSLELEPLDTALVNDVGSLNKLIREVESPALLANIDISHMVVRGISATEIPRISGRVNSVDYSDSNGSYHEHLPPGTGVANLAAFTDELLGVIDDETLIGVEVGPFFQAETAFPKVRASIAAASDLFEAALERARRFDV